MKCWGNNSIKYFCSFLQLNILIMQQSMRIFLKILRRNGRTSSASSFTLISSIIIIFSASNLFKNKSISIQTDALAIQIIVSIKQTCTCSYQRNKRGNTKTDFRFSDLSKSLNDCHCAMPKIAFIST